MSADNAKNSDFLTEFLKYVKQQLQEPWLMGLKYNLSLSVWEQTPGSSVFRTLDNSFWCTLQLEFYTRPALFFGTMPGWRWRRLIQQTCRGFMRQLRYSMAIATDTRPGYSFEKSYNEIEGGKRYVAELRFILDQKPTLPLKQGRNPINITEYNDHCLDLS